MSDSRKIKIVSKGTAFGTTVTNSDGKLIDDVYRAEWTADCYDEPAGLVLYLHATPIEIEVEKERVEYRYKGFWFRINERTPRDTEILISDGRIVYIGKVTVHPFLGASIRKGTAGLMIRDYHRWMPLPSLPDADDKE